MQGEARRKRVQRYPQVGCENAFLRLRARARAELPALRPVRRLIALVRALVLPLTAVAA